MAVGQSVVIRVVVVTVVMWNDGKVVRLWHSRNRVVRVDGLRWCVRELVRRGMMRVDITNGSRQRRL